MGGDGSSSWLRYAGLGCLGALALSAVLIVSVTSVAWLQVGSEQLADDSITPATAPASLDAGDAAIAPTGVVGVLELELGQAEFTIEPSTDGEGLRVDATYDRNGYVLIETLTEPDDGPWVYRVEFKRTRSGMIEAIRQLLGGTAARLTIHVPADQPLEVRALIREGGLEAELGGLWLSEVDVNVQRGGANVSFDGPTREPLERFGIDGAMSGVNIEGISHASPRALDVSFTMGGFNLDLRGPWLGDSHVTIDTRMGGGNVFLPDDVELRGIEGRSPRAGGADDEISRPTLEFTVSGQVEFN